MSGDDVCEDCGDYRRYHTAHGECRGSYTYAEYWNGLTQAEKAEECRMIAEHVGEDG